MPEHESLISKNKFYLNRFLKKLERKIISKSIKFPELITSKGLEKFQSFRDFDNRFTAPLQGFADADDFYTRASSEPYISLIQIPTLIVNALNDPFLPEACCPFNIAEDHRHVHLETPARGMHVGFSLTGKSEN